jgi:hypothetical protein
MLIAFSRNDFTGERSGGSLGGLQSRRAHIFGKMEKVHLKK